MLKAHNFFPSKEKFMSERVQLLNLPVYYSEDDYHRSIEKVVNYLSRFQEIEAIYQIGKINNPGISDIDLIVIFNDEVKSFSHAYRKIFDEKDSYLFMHGIFGMPVSIFEKNEFLIPMYEYRKLYGSEISFKNGLLSYEKKRVSEIYALEFLVENLFNLVSQLILKQLKVRNLLCSLKALSYDLVILNNGNPSQSNTNFCERLRYLRNTWWDNEDHLKIEFQKLCAEAIEVILENISNFSCRNENKSNLGTHSSFIQIGVNGYVVGMNMNLASLPMIEVKKNWVSNFLDKLLIAIKFSRLTKKISDFKKVCSAVFLMLPPYPFSILDGQIDKSYEPLLRERQFLLEQYSIFMKKINPEYAVYDIFRWHISRNKKWDLLRSLNKAVFLNSQ